MAIRFKTKTPKKLLAAYKRAIDEGHITTWSYDTSGDFTHTADQWNQKAWLRPAVHERTELVFHILKRRDQALSTAVYAVYHGRFIESMLRHCDELFTEAYASAEAEEDDVT